MSAVCRRLRTGSIPTFALTAIALALMFIAGASNALAQLPDEIMRSTGSLSASQERTVQDFVDREVQDLISDDARTARNAQRQLKAPLARRSVTRSFRRSYASILAPRLSQLHRDDSVPMHARIGSLLVLGTLATDDILAPLSAALQSNVDAVRYNAALGFHLAFQEIEAGRHGFLDERQAARDIVRELRNAMIAEKSPFVFNAMVSACVDSPDKAHGLLNVCEAMKDQLRARRRGDVPVSMAPMYHQAIQNLLRSYINLLGQAGRNLAEQEKGLVEVGFMAMQLAVTQMMEDREAVANHVNAYRNMLVSGERLLSVVLQLESRSNVTARERTGVSSAFNNGDYAGAQQAIDDFWLQASGPIYDSRLEIAVGSLENLLDG